MKINFKKNNKNWKTIVGFLILFFAVASYLLAGVGEPIGAIRFIMAIVAAFLIWSDRKNKRRVK